MNNDNERQGFRLQSKQCGVIIPFNMPAKPLSEAQIGGFFMPTHFACVNAKYNNIVRCILGL